MWSILVFLFWCWMALIAWAVLYAAGSAIRRHWRVAAVILAVPVIIGVIMWAANAAHAQQTKEELRLMLEEQSKAPPPPRGCVRTARGDLLPIARSEGDDVDMDACKLKPEETKVKSIFEVFSE